MSAWEFWIDRGGTFTDVIGRAPDGALHVAKVLSAEHAAGDPGVAAARAMRAANGASGAEVRVAAFKVGTTVATNALLERRGEPVLLVTTAGLGDALRIGYQNRPDVFAREIVLPAPLFADVIEVDERVAADGTVIAPLNADALGAALRAAQARGLRAVAIVFLHGYQHTAHEKQAAEVARSFGFDTVVASHEISPVVRFVARGDTTALEAYLAARLGRYVRAVAAAAAQLDPRARLDFMQSSGGLVEAARLRASASVLSGPAGGVMGMARIGERLGISHLIGFDMGGTSTDVSLYSGGLARRFEHEIAGTRLQAPMLDIHTIAAGGGSLLRFEDRRLQVGPASAGAQPGPACYGRGGPLTVTDLQVALGRLQPGFLPRIFGPHGDAPIDTEAVASAFAARAADLAASGNDTRRPATPALAESYLDIAVEAMANAVRQVAAVRGEDPAEFTLFCFGGAAPQHACAVAAACDIGRIVIHPLASVLSAFGIGVADWLETRRATLQSAPDAAGLARAATQCDALERDARDALAAAQLGDARITVDRWLEIRAGDSESALDVAWVTGSTAESVRMAFATAHRARFGYADDGAALVIECVRVEARATSPFPESMHIEARPLDPLPPSVRAWFGGWRETPVLPLATVRDVAGPALLVDANFTTVVEPGWRAHRAEGGELILERSKSAARNGARSSASDGNVTDPARIEIFGNLYMHIATQMGAVLRQTAQSINIKERLDYSCAVFDGAGRLIANAPHMPVHLGSMGASVRAILAAHGDTLRPGDAWMLNSPYSGGTHLPDITVVSPVWLRGESRPDAFVASRAHHADLGGVTPGSMPPFSTTIDEEGVIFEGLRVLDRGEFREQAVREALAAARYPARNPSQNIADLRAQLAANARGIDELERAARRFGAPTLIAHFAHVRANAEACVRDAIGRLESGRFEYAMDGGQRIVVRVTIDPARRQATIDFAGSSPQGAHNFNAPRAVCVAATLYVFRTLIDRPLPLNEGCLAPLDIVVPPGSMLAPVAPAAVVAGNVETSQCLVDALYGALGTLAASQGTMNNLTFGNAEVQYYETIAGGAGAGPTFDGASAVHTHMTNSRITDPEILELRFPVRLLTFAIRRGSGGAGRHRGGDGVVRTIEFLVPVSGAILANRRHVPPFGVAGGASGACGLTRLLRRDGTALELGSADSFDAAAGDAIEVQTPGGGGYGSENTPANRA